MFFCGSGHIEYEKLSALRILVFPPEYDLFHIRYVFLLCQKKKKERSKPSSDVDIQIYQAVTGCVPLG